MRRPWRRPRADLGGAVGGAGVDDHELVDEPSAAGAPRRRRRHGLDDAPDGRLLVERREHHADAGGALERQEQVERPVVGGARARGEPVGDVALHRPASRHVRVSRAGASQIRTSSSRGSGLPYSLPRRRSLAPPGVRRRQALQPRARHNRTSLIQRGRGIRPCEAPATIADLSSADIVEQAVRRARPRREGANSVRGRPVTRKDEEKASPCRRLTSPPAHPRSSDALRHPRLRSRHPAHLSRVRRGLRPRCGLRLHRVLRPARGRLRLLRRSPASSSRPARRTCGATPACCRSRRTPAPSATSTPA